MPSCEPRLWCIVRLISRELTRSLIIPTFAYMIIVLIDLFHHRRLFRKKKQKVDKGERAPNLPPRPTPK